MLKPRGGLNGLPPQGTPGCWSDSLKAYKDHLFLLAFPPTIFDSRFCLFSHFLHLRYYPSLLTYSVSILYSTMPFSGLPCGALPATAFWLPTTWASPYYIYLLTFWASHHLGISLLCPVGPSTWAIILIKNTYTFPALFSSICSNHFSPPLLLVITLVITMELHALSMFMKAAVVPGSYLTLLGPPGKGCLPPVIWGISLWQVSLSQSDRGCHTLRFLLRGYPFASSRLLTGPSWNSLLSP